jgi:hypothetical protein
MKLYVIALEYGPVDRLLEFGVFLLIAIEGCAAVLFYRQKRKRERHLRTIQESLYAFMTRGQELQRITPRPSHGTAYNDAAWEWATSVGNWGEGIEEFLEQYSPRAASVFGLIVQTGVRENPQVVYTESGSFPIEGFHRESYQKLIEQLNNLRSIMEKPEAYF